MRRVVERFLHEYFTFSKKERNGILLLCGILFLLSMIRFHYSQIASPSFAKTEDLNSFILSVQEKEEKQSIKKEAKPLPGLDTLLYFDPNTADEKLLINVGFSSKQARSLLRFREKGGRFEKKEDLLKLYVMTDQLYHRISPRVKFASAPNGKQDYSQRLKQKETKSMLLEINTGDSTQIVELPGIGPYSAMKILNYRKRLGGFYSLSQLREIKGLRHSYVDSITPFFTLNPALIRKLLINLATEKELYGHPYIGNKAKAIVAYRNQHGTYRNFADLFKTGVFHSGDEIQLDPYLDFR